MINMLVETLGSLSIERSIYAQSQNWCSKHVCVVYVYIAKNMKELLSHLFICCCVQVDFLSSHNFKVCTRGKFTFATAIQGTFSWVASEDEVDHYRKTSNSDECCASVYTPLIVTRYRHVIKSRS